MNEAEAALVLQSLGLKRAAQYDILDRFGSFCSFLEKPPGSLPPEFVASIKSYQARARHLERQAHSQINQLAERQIHVVALGDADYPALLKQIHRPPLLIYGIGDLSLLDFPQIAIVGSRNCTRGGREVAEQFAEGLAASGFVVTSGMALGIDGAAHRGALKEGKTVAVLGCGVDVIYPRRHQQLYDDIVSSGGAVISEMPPGTDPLSRYFPQRNRIISGLSCGVLVVEAALKSGSLITAREALDQGREVFAIPGSIHNPLAKGCHQLIREGAVLTESLTDMAEQLGGLLSFQKERHGDAPEPALSEAGRTALEIMGFEPMAFDAIAEVGGIDLVELSSALIELEIEGLVEQTGGRYQRVR